MSYSRKIAAELLGNVFSNNNFDQAIDLNSNFKKLDSRDKSLVRLIVLTSLRRHGQIDFIITKFLKSEIKKKNIFIKNLLRSSVAQIIFLNFPEYSVVHSAVEISKEKGLSKFVNGILRNICRNKKKVFNLAPETINIPSWISKDIINFFGGEIFKSIAKNIVNEPFVDIYIKNDFFKKKNWTNVLNGFEIIPQTIRLKNKGKINTLPYYDCGYWWVQGISATIPVRLINSLFPKKKRQTISVLDVGAAPGGKSFQLLDSGYNVTSIDKSPERISRFKENLDRLELKPKIICDDINNYKSDYSYDCILIDAPCSASGLIQKKPDILVSNKIGELKKIEGDQIQILKSCSKILKRGGYLIYSVCSIISNEGIAQIKEFLKENNNFSLVKIKNNFQNVCKNYNDFYFISTPIDLAKFGGADGFFSVCLKKI